MITLNKLHIYAISKNEIAKELLAARMSYNYQISENDMQQILGYCSTNEKDLILAHFPQLKKNNIFKEHADKINYFIQSKIIPELEGFMFVREDEIRFNKQCFVIDANDPHYFAIKRK